MRWMFGALIITGLVCGCGDSKSSSSSSTSSSSPSSSSSSRDDQQRVLRDEMLRARAENARKAKEAAEANANVEMIARELEHAQAVVQDAVAAVAGSKTDAEREAAAEQLRAAKQALADVEARLDAARRTAVTANDALGE